MLTSTSFRAGAAALAMCGATVFLASCGSSSDAPDGTSTPSFQAIVGWKAGTGNTATIGFVNADGSDFTPITTTSTASGSVAASSGGRVIVFTDQSNGDGISRLYVSDQHGARRLLAGPSATLADAEWPVISPDSQWVYFRGKLPTPVGISEPATSAIWRVGLDGSGLEMVSAASATEVGPPAIAPDMHTLMTTTADSVNFLVFSTGLGHSVSANCTDATYSPSGLQVACISNGQVMIYDAQFTQTPRAVGEGGYTTAGGVDWSLDGSEILAVSGVKGPEIIKVSDGTVVSSSLGTAFTQAAWVK